MNLVAIYFLLFYFLKKFSMKKNYIYIFVFKIKCNLADILVPLQQVHKSIVLAEFLIDFRK